LGGGDITLTATLKGSTVSVLINGQAALSYVFNSVVTDGSFGLLARNGSASFDSFTVRTDDPAFAGEPGGLALMASTAVTGGDVPVLDAAEIGAVAQEAIARWSADPALLAGLTFRVEDLPGLMLAQTDGDTILIDSDAAGYGWFIDRTPGDDREFVFDGGVLTATTGPAAGRMDLLTVVAHELGHAAGLDHTETGLMAEHLAAGTREVSAIVLDTPSGAPIGASAARSLVPDERMLASTWGLPQPGSPVINWSNSFPAAGVWSAPAADWSKPSWRGDFVNHLAQSETQRNPNASLRLHIPVTAKVSPTLSGLSFNR
jgi:hypothetical protein